MEICLITGTSTGIGHATALHLARLGYKVYASMRNAAKAGPLRERAAAENLPLVIETLDVSDNQSMLSCVQRIIAAEGRIDVLVNNAGLSSSSPIETYPEDEHRAMFEANYWGPVKLTQAVLPSMCAHGRGAIVNISSLVGRLAWANQGAYCASKFAMEAFSEALAQEVAPLGIRVAIIEPGVIASAIFENTPVHYDRASPYKSAMRRNGRFFNIGIAKIHLATKGKACQDRKLMSCINAINVKTWIGLCISKRLSFRQDIVKLTARLTHRCQDVVTGPIQNSVKPGDLIARKAFPQGFDDRNAARYRGFISKSDISLFCLERKLSTMMCNQRLVRSNNGFASGDRGLTGFLCDTIFAANELNIDIRVGIPGHRNGIVVPIKARQIDAAITVDISR